MLGQADAAHARDASQGLDEPKSSKFHPIFNYVSSTDFYTDGKGWLSLSRVVTAKQAGGTPLPFPT